jgi:hypothetical protein
VEAIVTIVKPATVTAIAAIGNTEHAINGTHGAADTGADRAANHAADRTGGPVTLIGSLLRAADDALGMGELGDREQRQSDGRNGKTEPDGQTGGQARSLDLRIHLNLNSLEISAASAPTWWESPNAEAAKWLHRYAEFEQGVTARAPITPGPRLAAPFPQ